MASKELLKSIQPLLTISRLSGFFLFSIKPNSEVIEISLFDIASIIISSVVNLIIDVTFWYSHHSAGVHTLSMMKFTLPILMYLNHVFIIFASIWIFMKRYEILKFLKTLTEIDEMLVEVGSKIDHKRNEKIVKILVIGMMIAIIGSTIFCGIIHGFHGAKFDILLQAFNLWIIIGTMVIYYHLIIAVAAISQRFAALLKSFNAIDPKKLSILSKICELHLKLADLVENFNTMYAPVMVFYFANGFGWICLAVFGVSMYARFDFIHYCTMLCMITHSIVTIISSSFFAKFAEKLELKREELRRKSYGKVCEFGESFEFCAKMTQLQAQINDIGLTVSCGFFDVNWKFVFRFFSAGIMYFIILVQFENSLTK
ncbi:hypothetical protein PVAND_016975 [Polypedilum vanderplanki]|uniref:Gustatory receptor n=1 Tax=Polypedilum vanderplanki TaxID=319348 RepID=A0A9J6BGU8_POLVA|nr:hypothetical protein PVAND_016975 [Polypedilum vanderplanki]